MNNFNISIGTGANVCDLMENLTYWAYKRLIY